MKKHILVALIMTMVMLLTACGGSGTESTTTSSENKQEQESGVEEEKGAAEDQSDTENSQAEAAEDQSDTESSQAETAAAESSIEQETPAEEDTSAAEEESKDEAPAKDITFEKMVAVDNDECSITINEIDESDMFGFYNLKVALENKSSEKTYMFAVDSAYINGVKADPLFAAEVNPEKKANEEITFNRSVLEENGVGDFTDIEIKFTVYDAETFEDVVAEETIHIYPYGEENATQFTREAVDTDIVLADDDNVTIIVTGFSKDDEWQYYSADLFLVNKTDEKLMISVEDASINGYMADPLFGSELDAGKCDFTSLSWSYSTLEENGIEEVEEIAVHFSAYDSDTYENNYLDEEYTLNP